MRSHRLSYHIPHQYFKYLPLLLSPLTLAGLHCVHVALSPVITAGQHSEIGEEVDDSRLSYSPGIQ